MLNPIHILNQTGVLASFSVAKKVTEEDIQNYIKKQKKVGKNEDEISDMLHEQILNDIQSAIKDNKIPGLISSQELAKQMGISKAVIDKMPELNRLVMIVAHKLNEKKYDKMSMCYLINSLVNLLNLSERDFEKFHREYDDDDDEGGEDLGPEEMGDI